MVLIFGEDTMPTNALTLGTTEIAVLAGEEHMGILLSDDKECETRYIKQRIHMGRKAFFAAQSIGSRSIPVSPIVLTKLYWSNCVSSMVHGLEILPLNDTSYQMLEQAHGAMAKMVQGQSKQTANVAPLATLGWRCMNCHLDILKLLFLWRLLLLPMSNIYKQVTMIRLCYHLYDSRGLHMGPLWDIVNVYKKYSLQHVLDVAMKSGAFDN